MVFKNGGDDFTIQPIRGLIYKKYRDFLAVAPEPDVAVTAENIQ